ncbi:Cof-type HAD-IIB family hydrolase [Paenibacillus sp. GXUN7292]|uniref:Cof-type HAD-IIB family hydrolase n=1 Tax=Paenibacillus sp. GXUN7292 TaxID=3422499 RepID=UPI003D7E28EC
MIYKLIAMDMDGTLLTDDKQISPANWHWIQEAEKHGIMIMLTTGRGFQNIKPYLDVLPSHPPIVATNGAEVWSTPTTILHRHVIPWETIKQLREIALELEEIWYWAYNTEELVRKDTWDTMEGHADSIWVKFGFATNNQELLSKLDTKLKDVKGIEVTSSNDTNREISLQGISKISGIQAICNYKGISLKETVAIGDGENDITMLKACGLGIAMENAADYVKQHADLLTASNENDGVAKLIQFVIEHNKKYNSLLKEKIHS